MRKSAVFCIGSREEHNEIHSFLGDLAKYGHNIFAIVPEELSGAFFASEVTVRTEKDELTGRLIEADRFNMLVVGHDSQFGRPVLKSSKADFKVLYQGRALATNITLLNMGDIITHVFGYDNQNLGTWHGRYPPDGVEGPWITHGDGDDFKFYQLLHGLMTD